MASKLNKKFGLDITGILDLGEIDEEHDWLVEVEDIPEPVRLGYLAKEFAGKDVKISITYKKDDNEVMVDAGL